MKIGTEGKDLIKQFEGCVLKAYLCPAKVPTIGWGSTGPDIKLGMVWTQAQADARFDAHVAEFAEKVAKLIGDAPTTQGQFDALVSFAYNLGTNALAKSTLLKEHKAGKWLYAKAEFGLWNKAGGKVLAGLTRRRADEAALYGKGS